jgi:hypothetical protein
MTKILLAACAALALGAVDANAQSADYHKASPLEQAKAACEIYADTYRGTQTMPWGAQHARAYDSCMTLRGYARN